MMHAVQSRGPAPARTPWVRGLALSHPSSGWPVSMNFFELATDQVTVRGAQRASPELLIEVSDVSTTLLGDLVGHLACRTRPAPCTRGVGHHALRHP